MPYKTCPTKRTCRERKMCINNCEKGSPDVCPLDREEVTQQTEVKQ